VRVWRSSIPYVALWLFQIALQAAAPDRFQTFSVRGEPHVSLEQWGRSRDFTFTWDRPNKIAYLNNRWARLSFFINSKKATYNGLSLWLSTPITPNANAVLISRRDLDKTILPILYPAKMTKGRPIKTIMIAAGHGGKDPGYQINKEQEKKYTLLMAKALKEALLAAGFRVLLTRETDIFVDLGEQAARANRAGADLFINLHYNAAIETDASGVETYCLTPAGAVSTNGGSPTPRSPGHRQDLFNPLLAYHIHKALTSTCAFPDRGLRRAAFQVLREINMPGVLIEGGFLSNSQDAAKITNPAHRRLVARAIVDGILSYKRLVERK
jgi:N-acetylmuramoyl-L-alanine amidase